MESEQTAQGGNVPLERRVMPLRCAAMDGSIDMGVGIDVLRFAAEQHPGLWDGRRDDEPVIYITDINVFAAAVVHEINAESEDGSTLLTRMLDAAIERAVQNGCEGVDHERHNKC